jgi:branched-chain amino acid aminotransferase
METVEKNGGKALCRVRLQVFSGAGGIYSEGITHPGFVIECFPLTNEITKLNENGLVVGIAEGLQKSQDDLSTLKTCNALIYAIGARQARAHKWNDALIRNASGRVMETTIGNIFWVKNGIIYTPPLFEGCIAGVMRKYIMEKSGAIWESILTDGELLDADEVFMTNAIRRIKWIKSIGDKEFGNKITARLFATVFPPAS